MAHQLQLENDKYRQWVKAGLGLRYLKEGLTPFCNDIAYQQHKDILQNIRSTKKSLPSTVTCGSCRVETLKPDHKPDLGNARNKVCPFGQVKCSCCFLKVKIACPNNICGAIYDYIVQQHASSPPSPYWKNTDAQQWTIDPWSICKCFINAPGYEDRQSASATDSTGLLHVLINNQYFHSHIGCNVTGTNNLLSKVRQYRNTIFHSSSMELEESEANMYIEDMIAVLQDGKELLQRSDTQIAVTKLQDLKKKDFIVTTEDFKEILRQIKEELAKVQKLAENSPTKEEFEVLTNKLETQMSKLKEEIKRLKENDSPQQKQLRYEKAKLAMRKKLMDQYHKTLLQVPTTPVQPHHGKCSFSEIYIRPTITSEKEGEKGETEEVEVKTMSEIFTKNGIPQKSVYLVGDAGSGKTSFCKYLVNCWCLAHSEKLKDEIENEDGNKKHKGDIANEKVNEEHYGDFENKESKEKNGGGNNEKNGGGNANELGNEKHKEHVINVVNEDVTEEHGGDNETHGGDNEKHKGDNEEHGRENEELGGKNEEHGGDSEKHERDKEEQVGDSEKHAGETEEHGGDNEEHGRDNEEHGSYNEEHGSDIEKHRSDMEEQVCDNEGNGGDNEEHGVDNAEHGRDSEKHGADKEEQVSDNEEHAGDTEKHEGKNEKHKGDIVNEKVNVEHDGDFENKENKDKNDGGGNNNKDGCGNENEEGNDKHKEHVIDVVNEEVTKEQGSDKYNNGGDNKALRGDNETHKGDNVEHGRDNEEHGPENEEHGGDSEKHGDDSEKHGDDSEKHGRDNEEHGPENEEHGGDSEKHGPDKEVQVGDNDEHAGENEGHEGDNEKHGRGNEEHGSGSEELGGDSEKKGSDSEEYGGDDAEHGSENEEHDGGAEKPSGDKKEQVGDSEENEGDSKEHRGENKKQRGENEEHKDDSVKPGADSEEHGGENVKHDGDKEGQLHDSEEHGVDKEEHGGDSKEHGGDSEKHGRDNEEHVGDIEKHRGDKEEQVSRNEEHGCDIEEHGCDSEKHVCDTERNGGDNYEHEVNSEERGGDNEENGGDSEKHGRDNDKHGVDTEKHRSGKEEQEGYSEGHDINTEKPDGDSEEHGDDSEKHRSDNKEHNFDSGKHFWDSVKHGGANEEHGGDNKGHEGNKHGDDKEEQVGKNEKHGGDSIEHGGDNEKHGVDSGKHGRDNEKHGGDKEEQEGYSEGHDGNSEEHGGVSEKHGCENDDYGGENEGHGGDNDKHGHDNEKHGDDSEKHEIDCWKNVVDKGKNWVRNNKENEGDNEEHGAGREKHRSESEKHGGDNVENGGAKEKHGGLNEEMIKMWDEFSFQIQREQAGLCGTKTNEIEGKNYTKEELDYDSKTYEQKFMGVKVMKKFEFVFYIPLRQYQDIDIDIMLQKRYQMDILSTLLEKESSRVMILLDGIDEWSCENVPDHSKFKEYTIVTTSRPWKFFTLRSIGVDIKQSLKLKGFDFKCEREMVNRTVSQLNNRKHANKDARDCRAKLREKSLGSLKQVPIILQQLICLWYDDKLDKTSRAAIYTGMLELFFAWNDMKTAQTNGRDKGKKEVNLPKYLADKTKLQFYRHFIYDMSQLAYKTLFNCPKNKSLAFDICLLDKLDISDEVRKNCLKLGIMTEDERPNFTLVFALIEECKDSSSPAFYLGDLIIDELNQFCDNVYSRIDLKQIATDSVLSIRSPLQMNSLKDIELYYVTMTLTTWQKFVDSLPSIPHTVNVKVLKCCITDDGEIELNDDEQDSPFIGSKGNDAKQYVVKDQDKLFHIKPDDIFVYFHSSFDFSTKK
ncbi:uncharacterized protein LOC132745371 [Ruditapes philippinarum]|uniref:uncharacterized protein LOC132745371 n=1 Tax=Ruditapes philippinarum TaxID=129788 RepID=UPI00295ACA72|nr:uncharacterized protein LOC132745371 [Ruditapes philippinarum]